MKIKTFSPPQLKQYVRRATLVFAAVVMAVSLPGYVSADTYDDQIRQIQSEVDGFQSEAARLRSQGDSLQSALSILSAQKNAIQAQVNLSQAKHDKLVADIEANEKKLASQQGVLASTISDLSQETTTSPIELLAGSNSIGDFIDRQEYRSSVQEQIQSSIKEIKELKEKLAEQKKEVEQVLADQKSQRDQLASKEAEQARLVAQTRGQESQYRQLSQQAQAQIGELRAQQQAAYAAAASAWGGQYVTSGGGGGYPWAGAPYPCWSWGCDDPWGLYYRECVSFTAWKVSNAGRRIRHFNGAGNANQWPSTTSGYTTQGSVPHVGDVAIDMNLGPVGHAMYVESVHGNGTIRISEYNFSGPGQYSVRDISQHGLVFITFPPN